MEKFIKYFTVPFIISAVVIALSLGCYFFMKPDVSEVNPVRNNSAWDNSNVVFDYADKLTDDEEAKLSERIRELESTYYVDVAVVTLYEDLTPYVESYGYGSELPTSKQVMVFADNFSDENVMGYNNDYYAEQGYSIRDQYGKVRGDSIVFVDNWSRETDGKVHSWISTSGRCMNMISQSEAESLMDEYLTLGDDDDPYEAYLGLITACVKKTNPDVTPLWGIKGAAIFGLVMAIIYIIVNWRSKLGTVDVTSTTYLANSARSAFTDKQDIFINKTLTHHKIESSSGGSGGHSSSGGFSHGGGGHSR